MRAAYRDDAYGAHLALETLLEQRNAEIASLPEAIRRIYARRFARSLAGITAIGASVVTGLMSIRLLLDPSFHIRGAARSTAIFGRGTLTLVFLLAWVAVAVVYLCGRLLSEARLRTALARDTQQSGDVHADLARLEQASPRARLLHLIEASERRSLALPLAGLMLLAPLTLHFAVYLFARSTSMTMPLHNFLAEFDDWIVWSVVGTGFAHAVLAYLAFGYARRLSETPTSVLGTREAPGVWRAYGLTVFASLLPGVLAVLIPTLAVAVTGLITIPGPFALFRRHLIREREELSARDARWA